MRLKTITISDFKRVRLVKLDLTNTTVLVGANNAGKSSILQAIHFAATCMRQAAEANKQSTLSLRSAEYIPSEDYSGLGHYHRWGNAYSSPGSAVEFLFEDNAGNSSSASVVLKSARNEGISINPKIPAELFSFFRGKGAVFSSYIPGLAGVPIQEAHLSKLHVFRKAASGDSNVVLRNILLLIQNAGEMQDLKNSVNRVYKDVKIDISFDETVDYYIKTQIQTGFLDPGRPLEFAGTGLLQVIQIFSYLILFKPQILLIDEPESHLHPTLQTALIKALQKKTNDQNSIALVSTHSPFVARGLDAESKVVWIQSGKVAAAGAGQLIRDALEWGALDKQILLCTEDQNAKILEQIVGQRDHLAERVSIVPFEGVSRKGAAALVRNLHRSLGGKHKISGLSP